MGSSKTPLTSNLPIEESTARIAVAFSGGLDSTVLLHSTVAAYGSEHVIALHVNHGLQDIADDWVMHCNDIAASYDVEFDFRILNWPGGIDELGNIEAQARDARYEALAQMCEQNGVTDLLLGHHQDDQAETVLLQLIRGSGLPGLSAMGQRRSLANTSIRIWRPFMDLTRNDLESYANEYHLDWIEDPTNKDEHFTRNFIRLRIMPILEKVQPNLRKNLSRTASHMAQAQSLLDQLADIDLNLMTTESGLDMITLIALRNEDMARANNALRRWIYLQGLTMPSEERLTSWWADLENLKDLSDHQLQWAHDGKHLRVWRQKLSVIDSHITQGRWEFRAVDEDTDAYGLALDVYEIAKAKGHLQEKERTGGMKIRIHTGQARKTLKKLFQELDIPPWQRTAKILCIEQDVLAVAGVGLNIDLMTQHGPRVLPTFILDNTH
ncbi:MAG: tRNA lysidine(34) synthetase TilS [Betaproteobacteria bacterium]